MVDPSECRTVFPEKLKLYTDNCGTPGNRSQPEKQATQQTHS